MTCHTRRLTGNTLHSTTISKETEGMVIDKLEAWLVEDSGGVSLRHGKTDGIGKSLTKRSSGDFDTPNLMCFWMPGCNAVDVLAVKLYQ